MNVVGTANHIDTDFRSSVNGIRIIGISHHIHTKSTRHRLNGLIFLLLLPSCGHSCADSSSSLSTKLLADMAHVTANKSQTYYSLSHPTAVQVDVLSKRG